jgi:hypothetical protein
MDGMDKYDIYCGAKGAVDNAKKWNDLPNGQRYMSDTFEISVAHCQLKLVRAGQQVQGGPNYWDAPKELSEEIIKIISADITIIARAIAAMEKTAARLLAECEQETAERMQDIQRAKASL